MSDKLRHLESLKVAELRSLCKQLGVTGYSKLSKADLVQTCRLHSTMGDYGAPGNTPALCPSTGTLQKKPCPTPVKLAERSSCKASAMVHFKDAPATPTVAPSQKNLKAGERSFQLPLVASVSATKTNGPGLPLLGRKRAREVPSTSAGNDNNLVLPLLTSEAPCNSKRESPLLDTPATRVLYAKGHWLERLFRKLHASRQRQVVAPPFPRVVPFTTKADDPTLELAFQGIHPDLYNRVDSTSFEIGFRFWTCRTYISLHMGAAEAWSADGEEMGLLGPDIGSWPAVIQCLHIQGNLWLIETQGRASRGSEFVWEAFVVQGDTGEVIGRSPRTTTRPLRPLQSCSLRVDWRQLISSPECVPKSLRVMTKDDYEFPNGVSLHWQTRMASNSQLISIANRVALASCVMASYSGNKLTVAEMDAEWLGRPVTSTRGADNTRLELYLPECVQVLSVHLPDPPFHSALAIVQRSSGRTDLVLLESGQTVGDVDAGVASLWQGLLGCNEYGQVVSDHETGSFWQGWESRIHEGIL